jgi:adenosylcobinamide-GDP ribazoletransferase
MTGSLHVEGFAKTVNGLNGGLHREETLTLFKETQVGPTAVVSVVLLFLLKYACLHTIPFDAMLPTLILMTTLSRYSMVQLACLSPYASIAGGLGEPFVRGVRQDHFRTALLFTALIVLICGQTPGLLIGFVVGIVTLSYQRYFCKRLGGITGDILSATNEVNEALVLLLATMMYGKMLG